MAFLPEQSLEKFGVYLVDDLTTTTLEVDLADLIIGHPNLSKFHLLVIALLRIESLS